MDCPGDWPDPPLASQYSKWFKNKHGWCKTENKVYLDGDERIIYTEWGLSDQEYFKRKLAGSAK